MSQSSKPLDADTTQPLGDTTARLAAIRLKFANKSIFRALLSLASAALLIRVMGMLNQIIVTGGFGAGAIMDAYFVASSLPILLAQLMNTAIEVSVIPAYTRVRIRQGKKQASVLFSTLLNLLLIGAVLLTGVMFIFRRQMIILLAPGLDTYRLELALGLTPFIFPVFTLMIVINFMEGIFNAEGQFGWPAYAGMLVPITTAVLVLTIGKTVGVVLLCIGMVVGLCLQLAVFLLRVRRAKLTYRPIINWHSSEIGSILIVAWPALFGALIGQAATLVDQIFASTLSTGSISALAYADKLISVPVGVIFVSAGRAALPYLSRQAANKDMKAFKETLHLYWWTVGIATIVLSACMILLAHPLVQILFQRGAFTADDTNRTAITLTGFVVGLTPMSFVFITVRAFSALGKTHLLMRISIISVIANAIFDYIFVHIWQNFGIALATSAVYLCSMILMFLMLRHIIGEIPLFRPPQALLGKLGIHENYMPWVTWKQEKLDKFSLPFSVRQYIVRIGIIIGIFVAGVVGVLQNSVLTLRVALASIVMVALLRYRFVLLIAWVLINALNGLPSLRGYNVLVGLTVPAMLLMPSMSIKQTFKHLPALGFLFLYLLWVFASIGISVIGLQAFLTNWILYLDCLLVSILTINVLTTRQLMLRFIDTILLLSTFIALYGIYGYFTRQTGLYDATSNNLFRTSSIFGNMPTVLALFLSVVIPLSIYRTSSVQGFKRVICLMLTFTLIVTLGLTFTRGAYIGVFLSIIIMTVFAPSRKLKLAIISGMLTLATITTIVITLGNIPVFSRFFNQDATTLNGRVYLWKAVLEHVDPGQLLGHGLYASENLLTYLHINASGRGLIGTSPHNLFLGTLYDHGIVGVTLLTLVFIALVVNIISNIRKATGDHRTLLLATLASTVAVLVQTMENTDFWGQTFSIYFWLIIALPFAFCWSNPKQPLQPETTMLHPKNESLDEEMMPRMKAIQQEETENESLDEETTPRMKAIQLRRNRE